MELWGSIKARFTETQDLERDIRTRFQHPEDQQAARLEYRQCEKRVEAAKEKLNRDLQEKQDRPRPELNRGRFQQQTMARQEQREASRVYKAEVAEAVAERDRALRAIGDARAENRAAKPSSIPEREEVAAGRAGQDNPADKAQDDPVAEKVDRADAGRVTADGAKAVTDKITAVDHQAEPDVQAERGADNSAPPPWTPEEREAKIAAVKAAREEREAREAVAEKSLTDDSGREI